MRHVTLKRLTISGLLLTAVVCGYIGMQLSRDCEQRGTKHETAQWFLAIVGGLAVGLATGAGVRIHWILRVVIAVAVTMLAIGALIVLDGLAWVDECD
jgi:hypothetical protein